MSNRMNRRALIELSIAATAWVRLAGEVIE